MPNEEYLRLFLRAALGRAYVRVKGGNREPSWIIWEVLLPLLMISSVVYAYKSFGAPPEYVGFVIIGGAMMSFWLNVIWGMGAVMYWEKETGNLEAFMVSPAPLEGLLAGMAIGGMVNTTTRAVSIVLMGILFFGAEMSLSGLLPSLIVFFLTLSSLYGLGMAVASLFLMYSRSGWRAAELLEEPVMFLSGLYYPVSVLPMAVQAIASLIPLTIGLDGIRRALVLGSSLSELSLHVSLLAIMIPASILVARRALRFMERRAKEEGRLILRWI